MYNSRLLLTLACTLAASCVQIGADKDPDVDTGTTYSTCLDPFDASDWNSTYPTYHPEVHIKTDKNNYSCQGRDGSTLEFIETFEVDLTSFTDPAFVATPFAGGPITPLTEPEVESEVRDALGLWNNVTGAALLLEFNAPPALFATASNLDAVIGVGLVPDALASAVIETRTETNITYNLEVYSSYCDGYGNVYGIIYSLSSPGPAEFSLTDTITHELGHAAGFAESDDPVSIMYGVASPGQLAFITAGDEDGLRFIYPD